MALWDMIVAGVEATMRGTLGYLERLGRSLLSPSTLTEAQDRVVHQMNITDPADLVHVPTIAQEQASVIDTARRIMRGEIIGTATEIPTVSTFPPMAPEPFRYLVIVDIQDANTGTIESVPVEYWSDVPTLRDDVLAIAENQAINRETPLSPPTNIAPDAPVRVTRSVIVSVEKGITGEPTIPGI